MRWKPLAQKPTRNRRLCNSSVGHIEIGSLSKAFSVMGGFIAAKQPLVDAYLMSARQRLFSIALTIPVRAAQSLPGRPAPPTSMLGPVLVLLLLLLLVLARETLAVASASLRQSLRPSHVDSGEQL